jgi:hypothetical protein
MINDSRLDTHHFFYLKLILTILIKDLNIYSMDISDQSTNHLNSRFEKVNLIIR